MPKQFLKINRFDGGINSKDDPRALADNQVSDMFNMVPDQKGTIVTVGGKSNESSHTGGDTTMGINNPGHGLFAFKSDASAGTSGDLATSVSATTGEHFIVLLDDADNTLDMRPATEGWVLNGSLNSDARVDIGSTAYAKAVYYYADGALRIADGNAGANNGVRWLGYVNRKHFYYPQYSNGTATTNTVTSFSKWYAKPAANTKILAPPSRGLHGQGFAGNTAHADSTTTAYKATTGTPFNAADDDTTQTGIQGHFIVANTEFEDYEAITGISATTTVANSNAASQAWDSAAVDIFPPAGTGFNLDSTVTASSSYDWEAGLFICAQTFIYEGGQESLPGYMGAANNGDYNNPSSAAYFTTSSADRVNLTVLASADYDPRIIGGRIYTRQLQSNDPWTLLLDISLRDGCRANLDAPYKNWQYVDANGNINSGKFQKCSVNSTMMNLETYETLNGYSAEEHINCFGENNYGYQDAVVSNRRTFVAHPTYLNEVGEGPLKMGDRILYTPPNRFDTFPSSYFIDIGKNDGDEFIALSSFADRLLAFKKHKLYIINISSGSDTNWFLESQHEWRGVSHPASVTETPNGVAWINDSGCYYYDGNNITDLTMNLDDNQDSTWGWKDFINQFSIIGYEHSTDQIIVVQDSAAHTELADSTTDVNEGSFNATDTTLTVDDGGQFTKSPQYIKIDSEILKVSSVSSNDLTVVRGALGTTAAAHNDNSDIYHVGSLGYAYIFDFKTKSWTKTGHTAVGSDNATFSLNYGKFMTNFVHDDNGSLVWCFDRSDAQSSGETMLAKWVDTTAGTSYSGQKALSGANVAKKYVYFRETDFNNPGAVKRVSKIYITYRTTATGTSCVKYYIDGNSTTGGSDATVICGSLAATGNSGLDWDVAVCSTNLPVNCQSFSLFIDHTASGKLEIKDISIEYRVLNKKVS